MKIKTRHHMNKRHIYAKGLIFLLAVGWVASVQAGNPEELARILMNAYRQHQKIPVLSTRYPGLNESLAYHVQKAYVRQRLRIDKDRIAGLKAGLTSPAAMKRFNRQEPVAGVLLASGKKQQTPGVINSKTFNTLMLETEIGFLIEKTIHRVLNDVNELKHHVRYVMPVIELPDLGYADVKNLKGEDIIASNIGMAGFIAGAKKEVEQLDLNSFRVVLKRDAEIVNRGLGKDALGDQWQAALWLVNTMVRKGWKIEAGHILLTGALGRMVPGKPGQYIADYGNFGSISFTIR
jgi:2-keto-4-pentenoate hydratase